MSSINTEHVLCQRPKGRDGQAFLGGRWIGLSLDTSCNLHNTHYATTKESSNTGKYLNTLCRTNLRKPVCSNPIGLGVGLAGLNRDDLTANLIDNII